MTRMASGLTLALGLIVGSIRMASGDSALIQTTAPLTDGSDGALQVAVVTAVEKAIRGARAMGFAWIELRAAQVQGDEVVVQIMATDDNPEDTTEVDPEASRSEHGGAHAGERELERAPPGAIRL